MTKWDSMPTAKARKMLVEGVDRVRIAEETGLTLQSIRSIASNMRKSGVGVTMLQKRYSYTGVNDLGQVVAFESLAAAERDGFRGEYVSACARGKKRRYLGYSWNRVES